MGTLVESLLARFMAASSSAPPIELLKVDGAWGRQVIGILQAFLKTAGEDPGPLDGAWETRTKHAMHMFLQRNGYRIPDVAGKFDGESVRAMQQWLTDSGFPCKGEVDGSWGRGTTSTLQQFLNSVKGLQFGPIDVDGNFGPETARSLQGFLVQIFQVWVPIDGCFEARSKRLLQVSLKERGYYQGVVDANFATASVTGLQQWLQDSGFYSMNDESRGVWDTETTRSLQEFLNSRNGEKLLVTVTCTVQDSAQLEISCTNLADNIIATLSVGLQDSIGMLRCTLANRLGLSEHRIELVHPAGRRLEATRMTFAELLGSELLTDLLAGNLALPDSRSNSGFMVWRH